MTLERNILDKLSVVHPRMLTENVLLNDVRMDDRKTSLNDLRRAVGLLESQGRVIAINDEDTTRIKITTDGLARLAE